MLWIVLGCSLLTLLSFFLTAKFFYEVGYQYGMRDGWKNCREASKK